MFDAAEDVEHHLRRCSRLDDVHDELGLADPPLHRPRQVVVPLAVEFAAILEPCQGKLAGHVVANGREPLHAVDHRPVLLLVRGDVEDRDRDAQQKRFDQAALAFGVPDTGQPLKIGRQIDLAVFDARHELTDYRLHGVNLDPGRVERSFDGARFRIVPFGLDAEVWVGLVVRPVQRVTPPVSRSGGVRRRGFRFSLDGIRDGCAAVRSSAGLLDRRQEFPALALDREDRELGCQGVPERFGEVVPPEGGRGPVDRAAIAVGASVTGGGVDGTSRDTAVQQAVRVTRRRDHIVALAHLDMKAGQLGDIHTHLLGVVVRVRLVVAATEIVDAADRGEFDRLPFHGDVTTRDKVLGVLASIRAYDPHLGQPWALFGVLGEVHVCGRARLVRSDWRHGDRSGGPRSPAARRGCAAGGSAGREACEPCGREPAVTASDTTPRAHVARARFPGSATSGPSRRGPGLRPKPGWPSTWSARRVFGGRSSPTRSLVSPPSAAPGRCAAPGRRLGRRHSGPAARRRGRARGRSGWSGRPPPTCSTRRAAPGTSRWC